jgi:hypothetical protein
MNYRSLLLHSSCCIIFVCLSSNLNLNSFECILFKNDEVSFLLPSPFPCFCFAARQPKFGHRRSGRSPPLGSAAVGQLSPLARSPFHPELPFSVCPSPHRVAVRSAFRPMATQQRASPLSSLTRRPRSSSQTSRRGPTKRENPTPSWACAASPPGPHT